MSKVELITKTVYKTTDGAEFKCGRLAGIHQATIDFCTLLYGEVLVGSVEFNSIKDVFGNFPDAQKIFNNNLKVEKR